MKQVILENRPRGFRASGVVIKDNKILLMKQVYQGEGFYSLPGGSLEEGETLEQACRREIKEEFNVDVVVGRLVYLVDSQSRLNFVFACEYVSGELELGGPEGKRMHENDQYFVYWFEQEKLNELTFRPLAVKEGLLRYLKDKDSPTFFLNTVQKILQGC